MSNQKYQKLEPFLRSCNKAIIKSCYRTKYIGFEKIPKTGPVLLISNHVSYVDGMVIQAGIDRPIRYMIDQFVYQWPIINIFMQSNRAIPILPTKDSVNDALDEVSSGLDNDDAICIFPEGRLTHTGNLGRFKPGIEWIIERDPVPVYPIALKGLWDGMFSRKYHNSGFKLFPAGLRPEVVAKCGDVIHPGHLSVNYLQRTVLALKNSI